MKNDNLDEIQTFVTKEVSDHNELESNSKDMGSYSNLVQNKNDVSYQKLVKENQKLNEENKQLNRKYNLDKQKLEQAVEIIS